MKLENLWAPFIILTCVYISVMVMSIGFQLDGMLIGASVVYVILMMIVIGVGIYIYYKKQESKSSEYAHIIHPI